MSKLTKVINIDSNNCIIAINKQNTIELYKVNKNGYKHELNLDSLLMSLYQKICSFSILLINKETFLFVTCTDTLVITSICHVESGILNSKKYVHNMKAVINKLEILSINCIILQTHGNLYKFEVMDSGDSSSSNSSSNSSSKSNEVIDSLLYSITPISIDNAQLQRITPLIPVSSINPLYHDILDFEVYPTLRSVNSEEYLNLDLNTIRESLNNQDNDSRVIVGNCAVFYKGELYYLFYYITLCIYYSLSY